MKSEIAPIDIFSGRSLQRQILLSEPLLGEMTLFFDNMAFNYNPWFLFIFLSYDMDEYGWVFDNGGITLEELSRFSKLSVNDLKSSLLHLSQMKIGGKRVLDIYKIYAEQEEFIFRIFPQCGDPLFLHTDYLRWDIEVNREVRLKK